MDNENYILYINKMLSALNNKQLKRIYDYVHRIYIRCVGD